MSVFKRVADHHGSIQVAENGLIGSILTLYELTTGGDLAPSAGSFSLNESPLGSVDAHTVTTEFYELPSPILKLALAHLIKTGRAQTFKGTSGEDGDGVKFF